MFRRSEKKFKAVFMMQFQATQVPQLKAKDLMISLVPVGVGKATVRLPKAPIIEGTCNWETPVYENVKLVKETKTGRIREKFYYVVVSTGSSKSGFLGEVSIDFADLVKATKPLNLTLPLQTSKSGAILNITVQNLQEVPDSRHGEDSEPTGNESYDQNMDLEVRDSYSLVDSKYPESDDLSEATSPQDEQNGNLGINQMKMLERKAELTELEVQSLRKQIMKETKRGEQLSDQIISLREERDSLKAECEQLKCSNDENRTHPDSPSSGTLEKIKQELQHEKKLNKKLKLKIQTTEDENSEYVIAMRDLSKKLEQKNTEISQLSSKIKEFRCGSEPNRSSPRNKLNQYEEPGNQSGSNGNTDEEERLKQEIEKLHSEMEVHQKAKAEIQMELERLSQDFESLETENEQLCSKLEQIEKENAEIQRKYAESLVTLKQFKFRVASLESENKRQALQYHEAMDELEFQVQSLQKELENQAQVFEEDLEAVTTAKVEQEQRAIRAEETLRKTRWNNENEAERLKEEAKHICADMTLKLEENEKLAQKAIAEANDLRQKNEVLEELLKKANEELQLLKDQHKSILREHSAKNKSIAGSNKIAVKAGSIFTEQTKMSSEESEMPQRWILEKEDLERHLLTVRQEAEKLKKENVSMKAHIEQKKTKEENLRMEMKKLKLENSEVKDNLLELELEKQRLKKDMSTLQSGLCKKVQETMLSKNTNDKVPEGRNNGRKHMGGPEIRCLEELSTLKSAQSEISSLKEINRSMEGELKEMHERYSEISLKFAEVEGERQQLVMALRNLKTGKKN